MMARVREERFLERAGAHRLLELGGRAESGEPATIQHGDALARLGPLDVGRGEGGGRGGGGEAGWGGLGGWRGRWRPRAAWRRRAAAPERPVARRARTGVTACRCAAAQRGRGGSTGARRSAGFLPPSGRDR